MHAVDTVNNDIKGIVKKMVITTDFFHQNLKIGLFRILT